MARWANITMKTSKEDIIFKLSNMIYTVKSVEQVIDVEKFSTVDLVIDLEFDSLDLINLFFQIEEEFDVTISEEEIGSFGLSNIENLARVIEEKLE